MDESAREPNPFAIRATSDSPIAVVIADITIQRVAEFVCEHFGQVTGQHLNRA